MKQAPYSALLLSTLALPTLAQQVVCGHRVDENATPDRASYVSGEIPLFSFPPSGDLNADILRAVSFPRGDFLSGCGTYFDVEFVDNRLLNGPGDDLVLLEFLVPDTMTMSFDLDDGTGFGPEILFAAAQESCEHFAEHPVFVDLSDWGVPEGRRLRRIRIGTSSEVSCSAEVGLIACLHNGPPSVGNEYCANQENSSGERALISASGFHSLAAGELVLRADLLPRSAIAYFAVGTLPTQQQHQFYTQCIAGQVSKILPPARARAGVVTRDISPMLGQLLPGTYYFQCIFRDRQAGSAGLQTSNGLEVVLEP